MSEPLTMWTIYERPLDFPNCYVVRRWTVEEGKTVAHECLLADSLEKARKLVPPHSTRMDRFPEDDPVIVETWI